jgi:hypothetical protein
MHDTHVCLLSHLGAADPKAAGNVDFFSMPFEAIAFRVSRQAARKVAAGRYPLIGQAIQWIHL